MSEPVGVFGGAFDPVHYGHLRPLAAATAAVGIATTHLVPTFHPPHRATPVASFHDRLHMLRLAVGEFPGFMPDGREANLPAPSYTVRTLASFRAECGRTPLVLFLGLDAFLGLPTWHEWQRLLELAHIAVMARPGYDRTWPAWAHERAVAAPASLRREAAGSILAVEGPQLNVAARGLRARLAEGEGDVTPTGAEPTDLGEMVPAPVLAYIREQGLYRKGDECPPKKR